jgi:hypothetical protein
MSKLDIGGVADLQVRRKAAFPAQLFAIMLMRYEAELHSQAGRARRRQVKQPRRAGISRRQWSEGRLRDSNSPSIPRRTLQLIVTAGYSCISLLEAVLAVPFQKMRVWPTRYTTRRKCTTGSVNYRSHTLRIVRLSRNQQLQKDRHEAIG